MNLVHQFEGYTVENVPYDGQCGFTALAKQLSAKLYIPLGLSVSAVHKDVVKFQICCKRSSFKGSFSGFNIQKRLKRKFTGKKHCASRCYFLVENALKTHLRASLIQKHFLGSPPSVRHAHCAPYFT